MQQNEEEARQRAENLAKLGVSAEVEGGGVNWHVDVSPVNDRSLRVHCFWYERVLSGVMLGVNPANSRSRLQPLREPYEGPEFYVIVKDSGKPIANGRTYIADEAIKSVRSWISGDSLETLEQTAPFIDERRRAMKAIAVRLDPSLRWEIGGDPSFALWVYGSGRSCCVRNDTCAFLVGEAQVAFAQELTNVASDIAAWLVEEVPLASLEARNIQLEPHADVLEIDPARWHWLHVLDRVTDPNDVLFDLASLIVRLSENSVVSQFYTYSSHYDLCFSASSHFPWVGEYPVVTAVNSDEYMVDGVKCSLEEAVTKIETELEASPIQPFFGSGPDHEISLIAKSLKQQGSTLRPEIIQHEGWPRICLSKDSRQCWATAHDIRCFDDTAEFLAACRDIDDVVGIAIRFLEEFADLDDLAVDPRVIRQAKRARG